jgi:transposase
MARFDLTDFEWSVISPRLPNKPRGVARADDRRVLNGIFWRLRTGAPWADIPERYGPHTTCVNRFNRWRKAAQGAGNSLWRQIFNARDPKRRPFRNRSGMRDSRKESAGEKETDGARDH